MKIVRQLELDERGALAAEDSRNPGLAGEFGDERASPAARCEEAERRGDRRAADAALAGDEHQPPVEDGVEHAAHDRARRNRQCAET